MMKLAILGDLSVSASNAAYFAALDTAALFGDVPAVWAGCDRVILNLETAVTDKDTAIRKFGPNLKAPFGTVETLKKVGVTDLALSNNHIFDFGKAGLADTLREIEKNGLGYTGIGENYEDSRRDLVFSDGKTTVSVINVCEHEYSYALPDRVGARPYDVYDTLDDVEAAKGRSDFVIVIYHGGKELCQYPSPRLQKLCRSLVTHGADAVFCQHSHCIGCYEKYKNGHILYGQGNFHFVYSEETLSQKKYTAIWKQGLAVLLTLDKTAEIELIPTVTNDIGIELAKGEEKAAILSALAERSRTLADGSFLAKWQEFCHMPSYYGDLVREGQQDRLAHYLDCEAHTDVLRELYPTWNLTNEKD